MENICAFVKADNICKKCPLMGVDIRGKDLNNKDLTGATLINANLGGANLSQANLGGATLTGVDLDSAIKCKTIFPWGEDNSGCK